jgi:hypothetical protein
MAIHERRLFFAADADNRLAGLSSSGVSFWPGVGLTGDAEK